MSVGWLAKEVAVYSHNWNTESIGYHQDRGDQVIVLPSRRSLCWDSQGNRQLPYVVFSYLAASHTWFHFEVLGFLRACLWVPFTVSVLSFELIHSSGYKCHLNCDGSILMLLAQTWLLFLTCTPTCLLDIFPWVLFHNALDLIRLNMSRTGLKKKQPFPSLLSVCPFTHARKLGVILNFVCCVPTFHWI